MIVVHGAAGLALQLPPRVVASPSRRAGLTERTLRRRTRMQKEGCARRSPLCVASAAVLLSQTLLGRPSLVELRSVFLIWPIRPRGRGLLARAGSPRAQPRGVGGKIVFAPPPPASGQAALATGVALTLHGRDPRGERERQRCQQGEEAAAPCEAKAETSRFAEMHAARVEPDTAFFKRQRGAACRPPP